MTLLNSTRSVSIMRSRRARARVGVVIAALALSGTLTACAGAGGTTCGEFADASEEEKREIASDLITESDEDAAKDELDALEGEERDTLLDSFAEFVTTECDGDGDEGTEIGDLVYEDA